MQRPEPFVQTRRRYGGSSRRGTRQHTRGAGPRVGLPCARARSLGHPAALPYMRRDADVSEEPGRDDFYRCPEDLRRTLRETRDVNKLDSN